MSEKPGKREWLKALPQRLRSRSPRAYSSGDTPRTSQPDAPSAQTTSLNTPANAGGSLGGPTDPEAENTTAGANNPTSSGNTSSRHDLGASPSTGDGPSTRTSAPVAANIWDEAWDAIKNEEPKLLQKYQEFLSRASEPAGDLDALSGKAKEDRLIQTAEAKVAAAKAKLEGDGLGPRLHRVFNRTVGVLVKVKDFVTSVASNEPHAALVWAGCCVLLPVSDFLFSAFDIATPPTNDHQLILNSATEREAALEGLADTTRIIGRYALVEADVFNGSGINSLSDVELSSLRAQLRMYLIQLYSNIIKFQIQLVRRCNHAAFTQFFRDVIQLDDWQTLLKNIANLEDSNFKDVN